MNLKKSVFAFLILLWTLKLAFPCRAQQGKVDTIPFSLETKLLVFKGMLNGKEALFAFDTGASESMANSTNVETGQVEVLDKTLSVKDANQKSLRLKKGMVADLGIGSFRFKKQNCFVQDMQYLQCNRLFLLGGDVIRQLNWMIDFEKKLIYVSSSSFPKQNDMISLKVNYKQNTSYTDLVFNGTTYKNILVDMGYTGKLTLPVAERKVSALLKEKQQKNLVNYSLGAHMTINGTPAPDTIRTFLMDSISIEGRQFKRVTTVCKNNTEPKLGLGFFADFCSLMILDHTKNVFELLPSATVKPLGLASYEIVVALREGKLKVIGMDLSPGNRSNGFEIDEVLEAIEERNAASFEGECDFLKWYMTKKDGFTVKRLNGQTVRINKVKSLE